MLCRDEQHQSVFRAAGSLAHARPQIAAALYGSFTLSSGQFCTKPGLIFLPQDEHADGFVEDLRKSVMDAPEFLMLTSNIRAHYQAASAKRQKQGGIQVLTESAPVNADGSFQVPPCFFR